MDEKCPIAFAKVEVVEAADLKPSDLNGLADPYVKGQLGSYRFQTKTQKKILAPKWHEEFKIPIHTWEMPSVLLLEVCDEDHFIDDTLGFYSTLRGGQRHDKWLSLQNIKMGRLHLAVTIVEDDGKGELLSEKKRPNEKENTNARASDSVQQDSTQQDPKMPDKFEPINIEGQQQTGIWVHYPGSDVSQTWEPRKRESRHPEIGIGKEANGSMNSPRNSDCNIDSKNPEGTRLHQIDTIRKSLKKLGSVFQRSPRSASLKACNNEGEAVPSSRINIHAISEKGIGVNFVLDDENSGAVRDRNPDEESVSPGNNEVESASKGHMRSMTKSILKQAGRSAYSIKHALSRNDSNKSNRIVEPSLASEREILLGSDSSNKEPISSLKG